MKLSYGIMSAVLGVQLIAGCASPQACCDCRAEQASTQSQQAEVEPLRVLIFTRTEGFRHGPQIKRGNEVWLELQEVYGYEVVEASGEDPSVFTEKILANVDVVVFFNTTGDVLDVPEQEAFEAFFTQGGGFVGIHSATDTEYDWPFYTEMLGAHFKCHPRVQEAEVIVEDLEHPTTSHLEATFIHNEEWYNFDRQPTDNEDIDLLVRVDENTYDPGENPMGELHPISWVHEYKGGRMFYTEMGHTMPTYEKNWFRHHVVAGIFWAAGREVSSIEI